MTNSFYTATGNPATGASGASATIRAEFALIEAAFDLVGSLPPTPVAPSTALVANGTGTGYTVTTGTLALAGNFAITGTSSTTLHANADVTLQLPSTAGTLAILPSGANKAVIMNSGNTALDVTTGTLALAGNFATTGAFNTTLVQGATVSLTLPTVDGTVAILGAASDLYAGTNTAKAFAASVMYAANAPVTVTYAASVTLDLSTFLVATITLTGNLTLANPTTGMVAGKSGMIRLVQDATGSRTLTLGTYWKVIGGAPTLTTTASAIDHLYYYVVDATHIECSFGANVS